MEPVAPVSVGRPGQLKRIITVDGVLLISVGSSCGQCTDSASPAQVLLLMAAVLWRRAPARLYLSVCVFGPMVLMFLEVPIFWSNDMGHMSSIHILTANVLGEDAAMDWDLCPASGLPATALRVHRWWWWWCVSPGMAHPYTVGPASPTVQVH